MRKKENACLSSVIWNDDGMLALFYFVSFQLHFNEYDKGHNSKKAPSNTFYGIVNSLFHTPKYELTLKSIKSWAKNVDQEKIDVSNVDDLLKKLEESDGEIKKIDAEIATENQEPVGSTKADQ
ncbi:hypothetical protein DdX_20249 [Ditylenchus destructor]|uniref:Uncharacterized protein n=1 Tax=Ditylenchus destructor TaxID=166010 RepID=A0AAD4QRX6_9BILA|nr:hypothetical protein DdX_20249 [Ditylenchus destructor]